MKHYLDLSESILHQAECIKNTSTASDDYTRLIFRSTDCMLKGAKYAGFRSISDMKKYIDIHGNL